MPININCLVYDNGKCLLPSCKKWYGYSPCILTLGDRRITCCALQVQEERRVPPKQL